MWNCFAKKKSHWGIVSEDMKISLKLDLNIGWEITKAEMEGGEGIQTAVNLWDQQEDTKLEAVTVMKKLAWKRQAVKYDLRTSKGPHTEDPQGPRILLRYPQSEHIATEYVIIADKRL